MTAVPLCERCGRILDPWLVANGQNTHLGCDPAIRINWKALTIR